VAIRIWYQSMAPLGHLPNYVAALQRHADRFIESDIAVTFNGSSECWYGEYPPTELLKYPYAKLIIQQEAIDLCRKAEADGYDAVILGSFSEPFLLEIRSLLDIPVVSMPESALLIACSLAEQIALVPLGPAGAKRVRATVNRHGLGARICGIQPLSNPVTESDLETTFDAPESVIKDFDAVARSLVRAGADVVIPAEGMLNELLYWNGLHRLDGAVVMDCVGAALAYATMLVRLQRATGIGVGRHWSYIRPPAEILSSLDALR